MGETNGIEYDDDDFVVDEKGNACAYDDEDEDDMEIEGKRAKVEVNPIMNYLTNMAVASNKQVKPKVTAKPKEKTENFMKDLFSGFDDQDMTNKMKNCNKSPPHRNVDSRTNPINLPSNAYIKNSNPYKLNPSFLPEFEKKLSTKNPSSNQKPAQMDDNVIMEFNVDTSLNSEPSNKDSFLIGREARSAVKKEGNDMNYANQSAKRTRADMSGNNNSNNNAATTTDNILQNRTPVSTNKTVTNIGTEYHTPYSHLPELTGRTPMSNVNKSVNKAENYYTPVKTPTQPNFNSGEMSREPMLNMSNSSNNHDVNISIRNNSKEKLPTSPDGSVKVYWYDAIEDLIQSKPSVILFGKIFEPSTNTYASVSVVIKNIIRTLYIYPKQGADFLQVYKEFESLRSTKFSYIKDYNSKKVKKKYCFELPIPHGEHDVIKVKYLADMGTIPANLQGETFDYIFGRNNSLLEKILLSRKLKGPCWLKIKNYDQPSSLRHTFCKYEVIVNDYKQIEVEMDNLPNPPLKIMSVSFKTVNNHGTNEIFAISAAMKENYYVENDKGVNQVKDFMPLVIVRKYEQALFNGHKGASNVSLRMDDYETFKEKFGAHNFLIGQNETAIVNQFINRLSAFDPDVIIGHNLYTGHMELLFNRITRLKISNWAKVGKFRRDVLPKFLQNSNLGNFYVRSCMVGRLICDTFVSCRDILRENNYNLSFLAEKHLKENLAEIDTNVLLSASTQPSIIKDLGDLLDNCLGEASLAFILMDKLAILPLTKQLTNIAGNLWIKSLQNSRADRCEMFLMHEFNRNKYLLPDKINKGERLEDNINDDKEDDPATGKKKPQYSGGLVLEPKIGLYDTIVLLLDFNSLYPTIIQEFNICFTTVIRKATQAFNYFEDKNKKKKKAKQEEDKRPEDDTVTALTNNNIDDENELDVRTSVVQGKDKAILPSILESLVRKRKGVKEQIKKEKDKFKLSMLDIKQKAIKLSANSLYGYLGYKNSRFYAKSIAALVTKTGRSILQDTVNLVTHKHNLDIIYGDTDSIMINTLTTEIKKALELGENVKRSVKDKYRLLEMEIDGVFKTLLLLKKKKYAFLKFEPPYNQNSALTPEFKGLDLVRRDWCDISKQAGLHILDIILSDRTKEEIINLIFDFLKILGQKMDRDEFPISDYEITKQLTKNVEDYADAKALPHVKVAKRLKEKGDLTIKANAYIPYVVCLESVEENTQGNDNSTPVHTSKSLADQCYHPKEVQENPKLTLDIKWYKENQIIASVSRLCKHIEEIDMYQLANCLGIDASKYTYNKSNKESETQHEVRMENDAMVKCFVKDGISITCEKCKKERKVNKITDNAHHIISLLKCECGFISKNYGLLSNNIIMTIKRNMFKYFRGTKTCAKCNQASTRLFLRYR